MLWTLGNPVPWVTYSSARQTFWSCSVMQEVKRKKVVLTLSSSSAFIFSIELNRDLYWKISWRMFKSHFLLIRLLLAGWLYASRLLHLTTATHVDLKTHQMIHSPWMLMAFYLLLKTYLYGTESKKSSFHNQNTALCLFVSELRIICSKEKEFICPEEDEQKLQR